MHKDSLGWTERLIRVLLLVEVVAQGDGGHEETQKQHEVEQNRGAGGPKHALLRHAAAQDAELQTENISPLKNLLYKSSVVQ